MQAMNLRNEASWCVTGLLIVTWVGLALAGCSPPDTSPGAGRGDAYPAPMNDPQISVLDPELREWIVFQTANITREDERPLYVQVPARNLTERQYLIEYRYLFFDENDKQLTPTMGWKFASLDPKQVVRLDGSALSNEARDYRLEVRWSR
jgi:hypothetical protein